MYIYYKRFNWAEVDIFLVLYLCYFKVAHQASRLGLSFLRSSISGKDNWKHLAFIIGNATEKEAIPTSPAEPL